MDEDFRVFGVEQSRLPRSDDALRSALKKPGIFAVGSGMMFEQTISNKIARVLIEEERNGVFLVGYAREDAPAHLLRDAAEQGRGTEVQISRARGPQKVMCDVDRFRFSGHSNRRQLLELVDRMKPETIILVHGEPAAREWMADNIRYFHPEIDIYIPNRGEVVTV